MIVKITSEDQVTFPAGALEELGMQPGDQLELEKVSDGFMLIPCETDSRPRQIDPSLLGYLADKIDTNAEPFDIAKFRDQTYDPSLRD